MSVIPDLATQTSAPQTGAAAVDNSTSARSGLRGMGYDAGSAALSANDHDHDCPGHDHGVEPAPGDTVPADVATTRVVGSAIDADIRTRLFEELNKSPRMITVLAEIEANGGAAFDVKWSSRGNYHRSGAIFLDRNRTIGSWIPSMMHELNHLNDHRQGRRPSANATTREEFVNTKMTNEIRAHAIGYVGLIEQRAADDAVPTNGPAGFTEFLTHLAAEQETAGRSFGQDQIQELAETWLEDKYRNHWTTSNSGENYYEYWGSHWDETNGS